MKEIHNPVTLFAETHHVFLAIFHVWGPWEREEEGAFSHLSP